MQKETPSVNACRCLLSSFLLRLQALSGTKIAVEVYSLPLGWQSSLLLARNPTDAAVATQQSPLVVLASPSLHNSVGILHDPCMAEKTYENLFVLVM